MDEFLYKYNNFNPDLIIYDTDMPRSESFKFASLKATDPKIMNMPTILLTGFVSDEKVKDFVHLNNSEFLSKISTNSQVLKKIECLMESSHPESNNAAYSFQNPEQDAHLKH